MFLTRQRTIIWVVALLAAIFNQDVSAALQTVQAYQSNDGTQVKNTLSATDPALAPLIAKYGNEVFEDFGLSVKLSEDGAGLVVAARRIVLVYGWVATSGSWELHSHIHLNFDLFPGIDTANERYVDMVSSLEDGKQKIYLSVHNLATVTVYCFNEEFNKDDPSSIAWFPLGSQFDSDGIPSLSIGDNGNVVLAVTGSDATRVYEFVETEWSIIGNQALPISFEFDCYFGDRQAASLGNNGKILAIGETNPLWEGKVRLYEACRGDTCDEAWSEIQTLYATSFSADYDQSPSSLYEDRYGTSLELSKDGTRLVVGAPSTDSCCDFSLCSHVHAYEYNPSSASFQPLGQPFSDFYIEDYGHAVAIEGDWVAAAFRAGGDGKPTGGLDFWKYNAGVDDWELKFDFAFDLTSLSVDEIGDDYYDNLSNLFYLSLDMAPAEESGLVAASGYNQVVTVVHLSDAEPIAEPEPEPVDEPTEGFVKLVVEGSAEDLCMSAAQRRDNGSILLHPCEFGDRPEQQLFRYEDGQLKSSAYEGRCVQVGFGDPEDVFVGIRIRLGVCENEATRFVFDETKGHLQVKGMEEYCLTFQGQNPSAEDTVHAKECLLAADYSWDIVP